MTEKEFEYFKNRINLAMAEMYAPFTQRLKESIKRAKEDSLSSRYGKGFYTIQKKS